MCLGAKGHLLLEMAGEGVHGHPCGPHACPVRLHQGASPSLALLFQCEHICINGLHLGVDQQLHSIPAGIPSHLYLAACEVF